MNYALTIVKCVKQIAIVCLVAMGFLHSASAQEPYNSAQLKYIFTGAKWFTDHGACGSASYNSLPSITLKFERDKKLVWVLIVRPDSTHSSLKKRDIGRLKIIRFVWNWASLLTVLEHWKRRSTDRDVGQSPDGNSDLLHLTTRQKRHGTSP